MSTFAASLGTLSPAGWAEWPCGSPAPPPLPALLGSLVPLHLIKLPDINLEGLLDTLVIKCSEFCRAPNSRKKVEETKQNGKGTNAYFQETQAK